MNTALLVTIDLIAIRVINTPAKAIFKHYFDGFSLFSPPTALKPPLTTSGGQNHAGVGHHLAVGVENDQPCQQNRRTDQTGDQHLRRQRALDWRFTPQHAAETGHHHPHGDGGQDKVEEVVGEVKKAHDSSLRDACTHRQTLLMRKFYNQGMAVWALGINHTTAPLDLRGRFAFAIDQIEPTLHRMRSDLSSVLALPSGQAPLEAALISTCNRTEIYLAHGGSTGLSTHASPELTLTPTLEWMAQIGGVSPAALRAHAYTLQDGLAARHAFRVACGLDSMVLGEPQILGQMKDAVRAAGDAGALGATLNQLFQRSFSVAKEVRSSTEIGAHSISMAAAAVRLAGQLFEDLSKIKILFVGAGEMIELCATHFAAKQPKSIAIANRTLERGEKLASRFGAESMRLADLPSRLHEFDAVISCTASTLPIIGLGAVERALKLRKHRPMFMVDLAVPRDIELEVKALQDVYLYTVDDLAGVVQTGQANRQAAVAEAETIIDAGVQSFMHWLDQRNPVTGSVSLIQQLNAQTDDWREAELVRARKLLAKGAPVDEVLEALAKGLTQKMLHGAYAELHAGDATAREHTAQVVQKLFLRKER